MDLQGVGAVVTGGASGIGEACVARLASAGAHVVVADLQEERGRATAGAHGARFVRVDVTDTDQVVEAVELAASLGPLRVLVAAAGIAWLTRTVGRDGAYGSAHDLDAFRRVLDVNVVGTFNSVRIAASAMSRTEPDADGTRGAVVMVASAVAFEGQVGQAAYAASKAALVGLVLPVARDLAPAGIRVNALSPGVVDTPIYGDGPAARAFQDEQVASSVLFPKRAGTADEQAAAILTLLTNGYLNGTTLRADAGLRLPQGVATSWRGVGREAG